MNEVKEQGEQEVNEGLTEANLKRSVTWNSCFQTKWSHVTYWANLTSRSFCNHLSALTRSCKIYTSFQWTSEGFFNTTLTAPVLLSMLQSGMIFDSVTIQLLILSLLLLSTVKKIKRMLSFSSRKLWFHTPISPNIKTTDWWRQQHWTSAGKPQLLPRRSYFDMCYPSCYMHDKWNCFCSSSVALLFPGIKPPPIGPFKVNRYMSIGWSEHMRPITHQWSLQKRSSLASCACSNP